MHAVCRRQLPYAVLGVCGQMDHTDALKRWMRFAQFVSIVRTTRQRSIAHPVADRRQQRRGNTRLPDHDVEGGLFGKKQRFALVLENLGESPRPEVPMWGVGPGGKHS